VETGRILLMPARLRLGNVDAMGGVMPRSILWSRNVPRVELDQRSREARLQFERIDQLFIVRRTVTHSRLRRLLYVFTVGSYGGLPHGDGEIKEPVSDRWPSGLPMLLGLWLENAGFCNSPGVFNF
jgi:hypothetical protein